MSDQALSEKLTVGEIMLKKDLKHYMVCRGHDGFPELVIPDLERSIRVINRRVNYVFRGKWKAERAPETN